MSTSLPKLDDHLKLWIKSKITQFYHADPYLKHVFSGIALSHLVDSLVSARSADQFLGTLAKHDYKTGMRFSRKTEGPFYFEYPSLGFHIESLLRLWPQICALYEKRNLIKSDQRFGHRPNVQSDFTHVGKDSTIKELEIRINCPLKIPFQEDYPAFKSSVVETAKSIVEKSDFEGVHALVIQSDIEKFFHKLQLSAVNQFIFEYYPEIHEAIVPQLEMLSSKFGFKSLPIGWQISGIISDLIAVQVHIKFQKELGKKVEAKIKDGEIGNYIDEHVDKPKTISRDKLIAFIQNSELKFKKSINYVDDLIFILKFDVSEQFRDKNNIKALEVAVTHLVLDVAQEQLNDLFHNNLDLKLYRPDEEKGNHFSFDKSNIDTLKSNFFNIANNGPSDPDEPDLWTRLDEFLLPADNDLTLNERSQFFAHLANLRQKLLEGDRIDDMEDIFQKILLKIQGAEAKYIASILKLLEVLIVTDPKAHFKFAKAIIQKVINKFETSNKSLELWLKFFSGYFKIYSKLSFDQRIRFFDDYDKFVVRWENKQASESVNDDCDLLSGIRTTFLIKKIIYAHDSDASFIKVMAKRRKKYLGGGPVTHLFMAFNVAPRSKEIRVYINHSFDAFSIASLFKVAAKDRFIRPKIYLDLIKLIRQKLSLTSAKHFVDSSAYLVIPKWESAETATFISDLRVIASSKHAGSLKRLISLANLQHKLVGNTYLSRLRVAKETLIDREGKKIANIPRGYGSGDPGQYRSFVFFLKSLDSNCLQDLLSLYLYSVVPLDSNRDLSFVIAPMSSRISGMAFYKLVSSITEISMIDLRASRIAQVSKAILGDEIGAHSPNHSELAVYKADRVTVVNLDLLDERFKKTSANLLMTICPMSISVENDFDSTRGMVFSAGVSEKLNLRIELAIQEAKRRKSEVILFPELCLPRRYLFKYMDMCGREGITLIAGVEYTNDHLGRCRNSTIISFPVEKKKNLLGRSFIAFEQDKHYPAALEKFHLEDGGVYKYANGETLFLFTSKRYLNFSILTCSDFLSLGLRLKATAYPEFCTSKVFNSIGKWSDRDTSTSGCFHAYAHPYVGTNKLSGRDPLETADGVERIKNETGN